MLIMNKIKVYQGQSFFDKSNESTGNVEDAFAMALLNGMSVTDDLTIGQELFPVPVSNKAVVSIFSEKRPATAITTEQKVFIPELGIGTMTIGTTFIVR